MNWWRMLFCQWMAEGHQFMVRIDGTHEAIWTSDGKAMPRTQDLMFGIDVPHEGVGGCDSYLRAALYFNNEKRWIQVPWAAVRNMVISKRADLPNAASDAPVSQSLQ